MTNRKQGQCRDESRQNIPWYVNGTLSDAAAKAVREHVRVCDECQADLELHSDTRTAVLGRELTPIMPATTAADIIDNSGTGFPEHSRDRRWSSRLTAIAAGIVIFGLTFVLLLYPDKDDEVGNQVFETATSVSTPDGIDYVLQLHFEDDVDESERGRIAAELRGAVKWAVDDTGIYEVHVRLVAPTLQDLQEYEELVGALTGVQSAKFTALQLPMR